MWAGCPEKQGDISALGVLGGHRCLQSKVESLYQFRTLSLCIISKESIPLLYPSVRSVLYFLLLLLLSIFFVYLSVCLCSCLSSLLSLSSFLYYPLIFIFMQDLSLLIERFIFVIFSCFLFHIHLIIRFSFRINICIISKEKWWI